MINPVSFSQLRTVMGVRWMMFVDGENFAITLPSVLSIKLPRCEHYEPNVFAWSPNQKARNARGEFGLRSAAPEAIRAYYYTAFTGSSKQLESTREQIWSHGFEPWVFRKPKGQRSKGVDINLSKDMLCHAYRDHFDIAVLVAGDGDYVPVVEEVKRHGKRVVVAFFGEANATSRHLRLASDSFADLRGGMQAEWVDWIAAQKKAQQKD